MIVKNEAHVIERCLASVRPFIQHWSIVDTGSHDGTQALIREYLHDVPGSLHERPWRDFGSNRSEAVRLARGHADYILMMDADHTLGTPSDYRFYDLAADGYHVLHRFAGVEYGMAILLADRIAWRYEGVLHEYVTADVPHSIVPLAGPWVEVFHEGARSRDPETYRKDAAILEAELIREPGNARYAFYLAQSLRDAGDLEAALAAFQRRAAMNGFDEETWYARYQVAHLVERLERAPAEIERAYLEAFAARPRRAEPLAHLARWHRKRQEWPLAFLFARAAADITRPNDKLFVESDVYGWRALDELAIAAWYTGAHAEGRAAALRLLAEGRFPVSERGRIEANLDFYRAPGPPAA